jgi:hypothetical protein
VTGASSEDEKVGTFLSLLRQNCHESVITNMNSGEKIGMFLFLFFLSKLSRMSHHSEKVESLTEKYSDEFSSSNFGKIFRQNNRYKFSAYYGQ